MMDKRCGDTYKIELNSVKMTSASLEPLGGLVEREVDHE